MSCGLDDVVAAETKLSDVDGAAGELTIRGLPLESAADWGFERLTDHLWEDFVPAEVSVATLGQARVDAFAFLPKARSAVCSNPVSSLRGMMATLPDDVVGKNPLLALAAPAVFLGAALRINRGEEPVAPNPKISQATDLLRMMTGEMPSKDAARALDTYLATVIDHGLNASTFTARVIASTRADIVSVLVGAIGALSGPLHGGAPGPVLDMLEGAESAGDIDAWMDDKLLSGERLMGFGHRIYKVRDPRADVLKHAVRRLNSQKIELAERVEQAALDALVRHKPDRPLDTNVEYYTALLLDAVGFNRDAFTAVFAVGRTAGWMAHAAEQQSSGRLIRPQSRYVGPAPVRLPELIAAE